MKVGAHSLRMSSIGAIVLAILALTGAVALARSNSFARAGASKPVAYVSGDAQTCPGPTVTITKAGPTKTVTGPTRTVTRTSYAPTQTVTSYAPTQTETTTTTTTAPGQTFTTFSLLPITTTTTTTAPGPTETITSLEPTTTTAIITTTRDVPSTTTTTALEITTTTTTTTDTETTTDTVTTTPIILDGHAKADVAANDCGKQAQKVSIRVEARPGTFGSTITFHGKVKPLHNGTVALQDHYAGRWHNLDNSIVGADGHYSLSTTLTRQSSTFRVVSPGSTVYKVGISRNVVVRRNH